MMKHLLALLLLAGVADAAVADTAALQRCRHMRDAAARLACYDAIPLVPAATAASPGPASPPGSAAPSPAPTPSATFGFESRPAPATAPQPLPSIESVIDGAFDGWLPRGQLKLANGQVWEIADGSSAAYNLRSPKVKITRGMSGSFFIAIEGVAQTPRVRRVR